MRRLAICLLVGACEAEAPDGEVPVAADEPMVVLLRELAFEPIVDGVSGGFDLDGVTTVPGDGTGCGRPDLVSPDGAPGIDNALGSLLPLIASLGGEALQSLVQDAVLSGELLLLVELDGLDEVAEGECTTGRILRGADEPFLGTDGAILPNQTFGVNEAFPSAELSCAARQDDGSIRVDGVELRLPLQVFDETIDLTLVDGKMLLVPEGDVFTGMIGGGVSVAELAENIYGFDAIPEELETGVVAAAELSADLAPDEGGACTQISVTLAIEAVPAFLVE